MKLLKYYRVFFFISATVLLFGLGALITYGLKLGIDFKGGTVFELQFKENIDQAKVRQVLNENDVTRFQIQTSDNNSIIVKTDSIEKEKYDSIAQGLKAGLGEFEEKKFDSFGPIIGKELTEKAVYQLLLVSFGIILYISYAFRKVRRPITSWQFGVAAIIALIHDLLVVLGVFALLGYYKGVEIDSMFVTAMLTVLGFSVHDTIVVFDRIRENMKIYGSESIEFVVNHSVTQTMVRSLNTSLTVLFVLLALLLFGGDTIYYFVLALFIGIITGTYSSIFIASPILVVWQKMRLKKV